MSHQEQATSLTQPLKEAGLHEMMEGALDAFEELASAVTRLQSKLEYVTVACPQRGSRDEKSPPACMSQAQLAALDLRSRIESMTVYVNVLIDQVRI